MNDARMQSIRQKVFAALKPPLMIGVREWAKKNRVLVTESSSQAGKWNDDHAKYQQELMDAFTQEGVWKIVIMASAQTGKTEVELNMLGRLIDIDPGPALYVMPSQEFADDFSKRRVTTMINACPALKAKVSKNKSRDSSNTISMKTFPGGSVAFVGSNSPTQLAGRPIRYLFFDEIDRFEASAGAEGNPVDLASMRTETFKANRRIVLTSTPTFKGKRDGIEAEYMNGTQEEWHTQCPHCGEYSYITFDRIRFDRDEYKDKNGDVRYHVKNVRWECPKCSETSDEMTMKHQPAKWVAHNEDAIKEGIRSFKLNAFMSPWSSWHEIAMKYMASKNDEEKLKTFTNTVLGESWEVRENEGVAEKLYDRREMYGAEVPDGVLVLTMGVDTQDNRLEYEVVGWDRNEQSWGINRGIIPGRPDNKSTWAEIDALLEKEWLLHDGRGLKISVTFVDSGGHYTSDVYRECAKRNAKKVFAIKGEAGDSKPYVRMMKKGESGVGLRFIVGVDGGKASIMYAASSVDEIGPHYMHFPRDYECGYDSEFFKGLISEKMVIRRRNGMSVVSWEKVAERNEPLDCRNYARAAYKNFHWNFDQVERILYADLDEAESMRYKTKEQERKETEHKRHRVISGGVFV